MMVTECDAAALVAAGCASLLPGLRAMRTNPVEVLRQE
jgi:ABC-type lipoprotein release transport system permease subunit